MPVGIGRLVPSSLGSLGSSKDEGGVAREEVWGLHPIQFGNFALPPCTWDVNTDVPVWCPDPGAVSRGGVHLRTGVCVWFLALEVRDSGEHHPHLLSFLHLPPL